MCVWTGNRKHGALDTVLTPDTSMHLDDLLEFNGIITKNNEIILFYLDTEKNNKMLNIVDMIIMLIMLVIDILVCPGDLISTL